MNLFFSILTVALLGLSTVSTALTTPLAKRAARTSPPSGCISAGNGGSYGTIHAALSAIGAGTSSSKACIFVYPGTYANTAQVEVTYKGSLTLYSSFDYKLIQESVASQGANTVTFTRNLGSYDAGSLDASSTFNIKSTNFKAYNINFKNLYTGGQAVAVTANAERLGFYACGFYGLQDTLYAKSGKQYYSNCYMEGRVDYIFGYASAWFGECTIASTGGGYITAMSRSLASEPYWYVFDHSRIIAAPGATNVVGKVYLGRPWRVLARVIYQNSELSNVIHPAGWTTMAANATPEFREFQNSGAGSSTSARLYLTTPTTAGVTKNQLFGSDWKDWVDTTW